LLLPDQGRQRAILFAPLEALDSLACAAPLLTVSSPPSEALSGDLVQVVRLDAAEVPALRYASLDFGGDDNGGRGKFAGVPKCAMFETMNNSHPLALLLTSLTIACSPINASQQPASATSSGFPAPDRPVASIITSHSGNEDFRDRTGEATGTMAAIGVRAGLTIADIGAGDGYFTTRLSSKVGPTGQVIATDVTPDYLARLRARVVKEHLSNVTTIQGGFDDPKLPPASVDVALMVRMYHEIEQPYAFLWRLRDGLKAGGTVAVSERDRPTADHGTPPALLRCEFEAVGYTQVSLTTLGPQVGYVAIFAPTNPRPQPGNIKPCGAKK
jgi:SAM-dependent methyltransferase